MKNYLLLLLLCLSGCTLPAIKVPPGSLTSWHHIDNYGFVQSRVTLSNVVKMSDGTFTIGQYDGQISWMGFGPHDIIEGLHIDGSGLPVPTK